MDLEARRKGIGGSDVGAILGYNSIPGACVYKTATEVCLLYTLTLPTKA